ncbi:uncharacterized protein PAF06_013936 [Gastrophryne carolinensis]
MAVVTSASQIIHHMKWNLISIFAEDVDGLCDELDALGLITQEEYISLYQAEGPVRRACKTMQIVLQKEKEACERFLHHLENMALRFPKLVSLGDKRKYFVELLSQLNMESHANCLLSRHKILEIGRESLERIGLQQLQDVPWYFIQNLMSLNVNARKTQPEPSDPNMELSDLSLDEFEDNLNSNAQPCLVHPMDVSCIVLHCADHFLQQEIVTKMAVCQFAVPLLLPSVRGPGCTFMIWAMRDIVKRWRPQSLRETKGFIEKSLVNIDLPFYSFVRLENCSLSKSAIVNQLLVPGQQHYDYFIHRNMEGGNLVRKISDGLVELACYFPSGQDASDIFTDPLAVLNLRGEVLSNGTQFGFLTQISSVVFIFADSISEAEYQLLSSLQIKNTEYVFILCSSLAIEKNTMEYIKKFSPIPKCIRKDSRLNDAALVKRIQAKMKDSSSSPLNMEQMIDVAHAFGIYVDEESKECQTAKCKALEITKEIQNVEIYKKQTMQLQGELWKELADIDIELCRMKKQGDLNGEKYRARLKDKRADLFKQQHHHKPPSGIQKFIHALGVLNPVERQFFVKWIKIFLDSIARTSLSKLQEEYRLACTNESKNASKIKLLDQKMCESSLGIEHFLRELGQFYEAEQFMVNEDKIRADEKLFNQLPGVAADLLLDGFPLELVDGDASNIPVQWIKDILASLNEKTGGRCKIKVITVLGVQSTGKSTLLNTMFGLQFPVANGRCTRGAFMTLVKVNESLQNELRCHFIAVIDTEGLKAPELASLEQSFEHDNQLATLVIGLSDITIINMSMENTSDMKDVLQIVVHAFLRMETAGRKPNCQFVHQNVGDVSAFQNNMRDRKTLGEELDIITATAAKMEKRNEVSKFADIMDYDKEKQTWYIPSLWLGVPPMASINAGYSEHVYQLKRHLFDFIKHHSEDPQTFSDFSEWLTSLWKAVKYETFIFSFRNSLVAEAYGKLNVKYYELQWNFEKEIYSWMLEDENVVRNEKLEDLQVLLKKLMDDLKIKLHNEEAKMREALEQYFESGSDRKNLIERYREEFLTSAKHLRNQHESIWRSKLQEAISIRKGKLEMQAIKERYRLTIEEKVSILIDQCKDSKISLDNEGIKLKFEEMWNETRLELPLSYLTEHDIGEEILTQLTKDMSNCVGVVKEKLHSIKSLSAVQEMNFKIQNHYFSPKFNEQLKNSGGPFDMKDVEIQCKRLFDSLQSKCDSFIKKKISLKEDYHEIYGQELLNTITEELQQDGFQKLHTTALFDLDVKLCILAKAVPLFQVMHKDFIKNNDPKLMLEQLKTQYSLIFENIFKMKDECQNRARDFCDTCLKPAIVEYVYKKLGKEMMDDIFQGEDSKQYSNRMFFQYSVLKKIIEDNTFNQYYEYLKHYQVFVNKWISSSIEEKYKHSGALEGLLNKVLTQVTTKVMQVLDDPSNAKCVNVPLFLDKFCDTLRKDLIIPQTAMKVITFQNKATVSQFTSDIKKFISSMSNEIKEELTALCIKDILSNVTLKPQKKLFNTLIGCGKECPFCKVPCEAGGPAHNEHFASAHRPQGLVGMRNSKTNILYHSLCSTDVVGNGSFRNPDTGWNPCLNKEYRKIYPDWSIQPDYSLKASDYWKFVFKEFNKEFAEKHKATEAKLPEECASDCHAMECVYGDGVEEPVRLRKRSSMAKEVLWGFVTKLPDISEEQQTDLFTKLTTRCRIAPKAYFHLLLSKNPQDRLEKFVDLIFMDGEPACQTLVGHLQELSHDFPVISGLFTACVSHTCNGSGNRGTQPPPAAPVVTLPKMDDKEDSTEGKAGESIACVSHTCNGSGDRGTQPPPAAPIVTLPKMDDKEDSTEGKGIEVNCEHGILHKVLCQLKMERYMHTKLSVSDILMIGRENLEIIDLHSLEDNPWYFLRKLMSLNVNARKAYTEPSDIMASIDSNHGDDENECAGLHPLDVLCAVLHCSNSFLQQEIFTKLSMCQFAVPLLLPVCDGSNSTFMLWAMRDIVKRWRPHSLEDKKGFKEDNVVNIPMPVFSFVRLEKCGLSKTVILNKVLVSPQHHHDFFIHQNMDGGNIPRKLSNGLVEMSWYFPTGHETSDIFPEPVAFANLRGDICSNLTQFRFLTQISAAVFIFADSISEAEYRLLSDFKDVSDKFYFVSDHVVRDDGTTEYMKSLCSASNRNDRYSIPRNSSNLAAFVRRLQKTLMDLMTKTARHVTLERISEMARKIEIQVDENSKECTRAKLRALKITQRIWEMQEYRKETMKLQGHLCKEVAETEKEICRMRKQGDENVELYRAKLINKKTDLINQQYKHDPSAGIIAFQEAIKLDSGDRRYFLKWLKFFLDSISRTNLSKLHDRSKDRSKYCSNHHQIKQLDQNMSDYFLGVEHFIRELAQFYEAESYLLKNKIIHENQCKFRELPGIVADLLLDGFPLEVIDGDASNIPLQWITDILDEVDKKTGSQSKIRVITVLGVQSTGKSTLLNTMFGLQFPVASGRCTRGAFMTLIKVEENLQQELGCNFILVLDTEGLKAPELASLDGSNEHDNELATLVVGLSDITIINLAMENATEMKDILQIVVHAFLRMDTIGRKPKYYLVHQNVNDVSAHGKAIRDKKKLIEELDEMARAAAKMEKRSGVESFSDVLDFDRENHSWYVPGLWYGLPPMASINTGYSEKVYELKKHLLHVLKDSSGKAQRLNTFSEWIGSLWKAVKHETFIFSFRNTLVADAYDQLYAKYTELKWNFSKLMFEWMHEAENVLKNQPSSESREEDSTKLSAELSRKLQQEEANMRESLERHFESGSENVNLIERYKEEFLKSVSFLRKQIEDDIQHRLVKALRIQESKDAIQRKQKKFMEVIGDKVTNLLMNHNKTPNSDQRLKESFEKIWKETFDELDLMRLNQRNIEPEILKQLRNDMRHCIGAVQERLHNIHDLKAYHKKCFEAQPEHFDPDWYNSSPEATQKLAQMNKYVTRLLRRYKTLSGSRANEKEDYHDNYCQELLNDVNKELREGETRKLYTSPFFELDLKLHVLGRAAPLYQKMHNDFIEENDPRLSLEKLKPQYFSTFESIFYKNDQCQTRAKDFCRTCLKPAIVEYLYKQLGREIVDDVLQNSRRYRSRMFFQYKLLQDLLKEKNFDHYMLYIRDYDLFVDNKIERHISEKYDRPNRLKHLHAKIVGKVIQEVTNALKDPDLLGHQNVSFFLERFCELLQKELVIPRNAMKVVLFQNKASAQQFAKSVQSFLPSLRHQILEEMNLLTFDYVLSMVTLKPHKQLFKRIIGCGKQCPFCNVPCEAGVHDHMEHFASVHRPQGLSGYKDLSSNVLCNSICTTEVVGNGCFRNASTGQVSRPYRDYHIFYPEWNIQPDPMLSTSDYWKFVLKEFNAEFAEEYGALPAHVPESWRGITKEQAMMSLKNSFNL